jgi:hypothetical protein
MPTIEQLADKTKKKFVKSDYRPWNYMEEIEKESNENQLEINESPIQGQPNTALNESKKGQIDIIQKSNRDQSEITPDESERESHAQTVKPLKTYKTDIEEKVIYADLSIHETTLDTIFRLTGHQKKIFMFIVERCASRAMLSTGVIKGEVLSEITGTTSKMVKTSIQRLVGKNLIQRERGKTGRGGFYIFSITELVRNAVLEYKRMVGNEEQIGTNKASFGNHISVKQKSAVTDKKHNLPEEWMKINIYPLEDIGFNHHHLLDIYETQLADPQMVQESILHFAYGIEYEAEKYKQYTDFLNVLIGRLRKGKPWFEKSYRSPQEIAQDELLEARKNGIERRKKVEEEAFKIALAEWQEELDPSELATITEKKGSGDIMPAAAKISKYFRDTIWPEQKKAYLILEG